MTHHGSSLEDIKAAANARPYEVLRALGINEKQRGNYIHMCNPVEKDRRPSFTIWPERGGFLTYKDHSGDSQGDIIDLVAYVKGWWDGRTRPLPRDACRMSLRFLADVCGIEQMTAEQRRADAARSIARARVEEKRAAEDLAAKQVRAFKLWCDGRPIHGTYVDNYLLWRGINIEWLPRGPRNGDRTPKILRYLPNHMHAESGRTWPCMIAGCVDAAGTIGAVHRTWLDPVTFHKADIAPNRKVWPDFRGLVIPLWRGDSGLSVKDAAAAGLRETLVLAEGIETALSAAIAAPQFRTWAFISLGNLQNVTLPDCIDSVMLSHENDHGNRAAEESFARGKAALERQGRPVAEVVAPVGKDLNDTLRGAA